ncbi:hypothetical protein BGZ68_004002 [Mortierella alpina]|nr:hypothetical protein BGZ68_004002 [Mortierella alpina]
MYAPLFIAGHCLDAARSVYLGSVKKKKGRHLRIVKAVRADSDNSIGANDIAVAFLSEKVDGPYALIEDTSYPEEGSKLTVAGFGLTKIGDLNGVSGSRILLKVEVNIGSKSACAAHKKGRRTFDPDTQVCATDKPLGHSACHGDSGGPLYAGSSNDLRVVGLVSGPGDKTECGEQDTYQYYTFIKPYVPWVKSETKKFEKSGTNSTEAGTNT